MKKKVCFTEFLALIIEYSVKNLKKNSNNYWKLKFSKWGNEKLKIILEIKEKLIFMKS
jgi:hypothetical protein